MLTRQQYLYPSPPVRRTTMPMPFASPLRLTDDERQGVESLARAHFTPQALAFRCRLILRVAAPEAPTNLRVAVDLHCHRQTVSLWRTRYLGTRRCARCAPARAAAALFPPRSASLSCHSRRVRRQTTTAQ